MCTGGENSLILIKLYIYVQVFYIVRLPSKKKSLPVDPLFSGMLPETFFFFWPYSENQCISKLDKIGIFIDMKFH